MVIGAVLGFTLGPQFDFDPERAGEIAAYGSAAICGPLFVLAMAREAFARLFSQVRFEPDRLEFDRLGTTHRWPLGHLRALRVTSQSTNVYHVTVTEVAVCLLGPDGRRLHLTDLKSDLAAELVGAASIKMAEAMALQLEREPLRFGPTLAGQLNIYSLGPPLLWTPLLAAASLAWPSFLLTLSYFAHMAWKMNRTSIVVTSTGLRNLRGEEVAWSEVKSGRAGLDEVVVDSSAGTWKAKLLRIDPTMIQDADPSALAASDLP